MSVLGDGFTAEDRRRQVSVEKGVSGNTGRLIRVEEKLIAFVTANTKSHKDADKKCDRIENVANAAHRRVDDVEESVDKIEKGLDRKAGFFSGVVGTIAMAGTIMGVVAALAVSIWTSLKSH